MNDPIGDMLTRIRNAQLRGKSTVKTPASKLRGWVLDVLQNEGYIRGYEAGTGVNGHPELEISLKSTPQGVMSDAQARAANVGGEVLCTIF